MEMEVGEGGGGVPPLEATLSVGGATLSASAPACGPSLLGPPEAPAPSLFRPWALEVSLPTVEVSLTRSSPSVLVKTSVRHRDSLYGRSPQSPLA